MARSAVFDENFVRPFVMGAATTLKDFSGIEVTLREFGPAGSLDTPRISIAGVIGVTGKHFQGSFTIGFPKETFLKIMNKILQADYTEIGPELQDGVAEISNIIFGQAKRILNEKGHNVQLAIPTVLRGKDLNALGRLAGPTTEVIVNTDHGPIVMHLTGGSLGSISEDDAPEEIVDDNPHPPKLDTQVLVAFIRAVRTALEVQCRVNSEAGEPFAKSPQASLPFDIGGMIWVSGRTFRGNFSVYFSQAVFLQVVENMTGQRMDSISNDVRDAAAELTNITYGLAKRVLNEAGYQLMASIPIVVDGEGIEASQAVKRPTVVVPFKLDSGSIWLEFAFDQV